MTTPTDAAVQQLVHRTEITDLIHRFGVALDAGQFDDLWSLLVEGVTFRTPGGTSEGRDAVVAQARRNHRPEQPTQHVITNLLIDLDGARAHARANVVVAFGPLASDLAPDRPWELPLAYATGGVSRFDLVRVPDGWRFSGIETLPVWTSGTPPFRGPIDE